MLSSSFFSFLAAVVASSAATASAQSSLPPFQLTAILTGQLNVTSTQIQTEGPFGTRVHVELTGGDLVNATTGEVVANILSYADNGIKSESGVRFPSSITPLTWSADGHFASVILNGIGQQSRDVMYAHVETDSPTYSWMNSKFFVVQADTSNLPVVSFTMYEDTTSA